MLVGASLMTLARIDRGRRDGDGSVVATQPSGTRLRSRVSRGARRPLSSEGLRVAGRRAALRPNVRCLAGGPSGYARTKGAATECSKGLTPALGAGSITVHPSQPGRRHTAMQPAGAGWAQARSQTSSRLAIIVPRARASSVSPAATAAPPCAASRLAMATPMPLEVPATTATLPASLKWVVIGFMYRSV
jgi:hypothetical protein